MPQAENYRKYNSLLLHFRWKQLEFQVVRIGCNAILRGNILVKVYLPLSKPVLKIKVIVSA
jgi:hypothetical protein